MNQTRLGGAADQTRIIQNRFSLNRDNEEMDTTAIQGNQREEEAQNQTMMLGDITADATVIMRQGNYFGGSFGGEEDQAID